MTDLVMIVPTRGRPDNAVEVAKAIAYNHTTVSTHVLFAVDDDDPTLPDYEHLHELVRCGRWQPMVSKLNKVAVQVATRADAPFAVGFMGDDHRPRGEGWDVKMVAALREMRTGVVYGDDKFQGERLCSSWVMTSDIIRTLGRMVPAPVEHMFCDNAVMDLARAAKCLRYLPDVVIEHLHPLAGKSAWDPGYWRVNQPAQYERDGATYRTYRAIQFDEDVSTLTALREVRVG